MSSYEQGSASGAGQGAEGLKERAVETVAEVDAGAMHVAGVAGQEAASVAQEAKSAARGFFQETRTQLADQASTQQHRAAQAIRSTADELAGMADGAQSDGVVTGLVRGIGDQTRHVAAWLDEREPADLVREVRDFARRHTGAFLAAAVGLGILAGRLTKAMIPSDDQNSGSGSGSTGYGASSLGTTGSGAVGTGAAGYAAIPSSTPNETPIGDALAGEPAIPGAGSSMGGTTTGTGGDEWSPSGGTQR